MEKIRFALSRHVRSCCSQIESTWGGLLGSVWGTEIAGDESLGCLGLVGGTDEIDL